LIATKKGAAVGQLESAILLWFNEADPISILVLASNAHDCFHALGKKIGKPSWWMTWLESMPPAFKERAKNIFRISLSMASRTWTRMPRMRPRSLK
jgi:hypothetical protein